MRSLIPNSVVVAGTSPPRRQPAPSHVGRKLADREAERRRHQLVTWRERMGLTVAEAADALGIAKQRLRENLYDKKRPPSKRTLRLAEMLEHERNSHA